MVYYLAFDLETTSLYADEGIIICYALVGQDGFRATCAVERPEDEPWLLAKFLKVLWDANLRHPSLRILTYNGSGFDLPMLITRLIAQNLFKEVARFKKNFHSSLKHLDLYQVARNNILISSRKLKDLCNYFKIAYELEERNTLELWRNKEFEALKSYCLSHASLLHELRRKFIELNILERD